MKASRPWLNWPARVHRANARKAAATTAGGNRVDVSRASALAGEALGRAEVAQVRKIAETKMKDLSANSIEAAMKIILGSAKSCGIEVKG